ncbi:element excision factor XisI family protein [Lewinella sp. 4G2]|uniref:element excision factor XisI family protein n=1 Tax=Lewinella sp. 4G2 TaxID=1803372 RepID=UPI0007B470E9|nr:element excision factor XisI family protein [Lewinella sp. 4G2]OAV43817.1 hypothetical protein A3850_004580 [Lewinella sp. 4G2]
MDKRKINFELACGVVEQLHRHDLKGPNPIQDDMVVDPISGSLLLYYDTWNEETRTYGCYLHLKVAEDGKVWVKHDGTDIVVIDLLEAAGIPSKEIVVGWHHPAVRKMTEFAEG